MKMNKKNRYRSDRKLVLKTDVLCHIARSVVIRTTMLLNHFKDSYTNHFYVIIVLSSKRRGLVYQCTNFIHNIQIRPTKANFNMRMYQYREAATTACVELSYLTGACYLIQVMRVRVRVDQARVVGSRCSMRVRVEQACPCCWSKVPDACTCRPGTCQIQVPDACACRADT